MMATLTQGTADEFIEMHKQGWAKGVSMRFMRRDLIGWQADQLGRAQLGLVVPIPRKEVEHA